MRPLGGLAALFLWALTALAQGVSPTPDPIMDTLYYVTTGTTAGKVLNIEPDVTEMMDAGTRGFKKINTLLVHRIRYANGRSVMLHPRLDTLEAQCAVCEKALQAPGTGPEKDSLQGRLHAGVGLIISQVHLVGLRVQCFPLEFLSLEGTYAEDDEIDFKPIGRYSYPADFKSRRSASLDLRGHWTRERARFSLFAGLVWLKTSRYSLLEDASEWEREDASPNFLQTGVAFEVLMESRFAPGIQTAYFIKLNDDPERAGLVPSLVLSYYF